MISPRNQQGLTLVELLISLLIAAMLLVGVRQLVSTGFAIKTDVDKTVELARNARFAMARMVEAVSEGGVLLIPQSDNPSTAAFENIRDANADEVSRDTAVLAITLGARRDLDSDGVADSDNDRDGLIDEDLPSDTTNDGEPGLSGFDDDGNGVADFFFSSDQDDDESNDTARDEDPINGLDDDGDGSIDEDPGADNNDDGQPGVAGVDDDGDGQIDEGDVDDDDEDGLVDEDWYDPVVFYLNGSKLVERRPVPWDENADGEVTGRDYIESTVIDSVHYLKFERQAKNPNQHQLVDITLELLSEGETFSLETTVRLGSSR